MRVVVITASCRNALHAVMASHIVAVIELQYTPDSSEGEMIRLAQPQITAAIDKHKEEIIAPNNFTFSIEIAEVTPVAV